MSTRPALAVATVLTAVFALAATAGAGPLVADAGDSGFVAAGRPAHFLGTAFGGTEPYSFAWSHDMPVADAVQDPGNATGVVFTQGVPGGSYTLTLTVTDAVGETAADTVKLVVQEPDGGTEQTLADEVVTDAEAKVTAPAYKGDPDPLVYTLQVPAGLERIDGEITWNNDANDYDLSLRRPDGTEADDSGNSLAIEEVSAVDPAPGTWTLELHRYNTAANAAVAQDIHIVFTAVVRPEGAGDPRPTVDAGGPYRFVTGEPQALNATATGGQGTTVAWDLDFDGVYETDGAAATAELPKGRHLITAKATTTDGMEDRQTTWVLVGTPNEIVRATVPFVVIGMSDSGINPYHIEYSAEQYPDPEVLEATKNFTLHPCEYLENYPCSAKPIPVTHGEYFPERDGWMWNQNDWVEPNQLYWVPGTKIVGAVDAGGSTGATSGDDVYPILDDNGHGTGSSSVSTGNRYGYCPTCLIFMVEALDETAVISHPWVDISSHSHGYVGGAPIGLIDKVLDPTGNSVGEETREAVERGLNVLFAAGNGIGNAFDVPQRTYDSDQTGPNWNITVGALRRDNQGAIVGDGIPAHISSWGDGNLPSACRTGVHGQCAFGGTSAATPYTAGTFGTVLTRIRDLLGDHRVGPRSVLLPSGATQGQVIAQGEADPNRGHLADGLLTRRELRAAILKTAAALNTTGEPPTYAYTLTFTQEEGRYAVEGYGAATPNAADRATAVLLGTRPMPDRMDADPFFQQDCETREDLYGRFDRDGDGIADGCTKDVSGDPRFQGTGVLTTETPFADWWDAGRFFVERAPSMQPATYYLHRVEKKEAPRGSDGTCAENDNEQYMDRTNSAGDLEPCFDSRITSNAAAFRPKGIYTATDELDGTLAPDSIAYVTVYLQASSEGVAPEALTGQIEAVLVAGDREIGRSEPQTVTTSPIGWVPVDFAFRTVMPAYPGEHLTLYFAHAGFPAWAYGHEGDHASNFSVLPAALADTPAHFGVTIDAPGTTRPSGEFLLVGSVAFPDRGSDPKNAGFHPNVDVVQVSLGDPDFGDPRYAFLFPETGLYHLRVDELPKHVKTIHVRALRDRTPSPVTSLTFSGGGGGGGGGGGDGDGHPHHDDDPNHAHGIHGLHEHHTDDGHDHDHERGKKPREHWDGPDDDHH